MTLNIESFKRFNQFEVICVAPTVSLSEELFQQIEHDSVFVSEILMHRFLGENLHFFTFEETVPNHIK